MFRFTRRRQSNIFNSLFSIHRRNGSKSAIKYNYSLYTVVDASVLAYHLPLIRNMVNSRTSIVVIPKCGKNSDNLSVISEAKTSQSDPEYEINF